MTGRDDSTRASERPRHLVLLGHPVAHSLSPHFQNAALRAAGIACEYVARDVPPESLADVLDALRASHAAGNVTIPHKEAVARLAHRLTDIARVTGAANTFWFENGALVGHNTDVAGVMRALQHGNAEVATGARCAVLGAGGSASAAMLALETLGAARIALWSRTRARAESLAALATARATSDIRVADSAEAACANATVIVNATPVGMRDDEHPVAIAALARGATVLDLVYRRGETAWVRACRAAGLRAQDGLRMLVEQGAEAFRCWFGTEPDRRAMWSTLEPRE